MIKPLHRQPRSRVAYYLWLLPLYLLLVPIFKVLEWTGRWPGKILPKAMRNFFVWPQEFQPGEHDVIVSSYFKSGTNWMLQITAQIAWRGKAGFAHIHDLVPWPEMKSMRPDRPFAISYKDVDPAVSPTGLRVVKTHFAPDKGVPFNAGARYICLIRDPKSVFESSYHFTRATNFGAMMPSVTSWLDLYLSDDASFGSWANFTAACWAVRDKPNVLFLTYEQMKRDLPGTVTRIAQFMGVTLNAEEFDAVVTQAGFAHMKSIGHKFDPIGVGPPWVTPEGAMIRKGESKSGHEMAPGTNARIDDWCRQRLQQLHSDFPYDEHYGPKAR